MPLAMLAVSSPASGSRIPTSHLPHLSPIIRNGSSSLLLAARYARGATMAASRYSLHHLGVSSPRSGPVMVSFSPLSGVFLNRQLIQNVGSMLAVADAQVVVLHRVEDGQDKSYRLRGTQVRIFPSDWLAVAYPFRLTSDVPFNSDVAFYNIRMTPATYSIPTHCTTASSHIRFRTTVSLMLQDRILLPSPPLPFRVIPILSYPLRRNRRQFKFIIKC
jgi:hypothetical protein